MRTRIAALAGGAVVAVLARLLPAASAHAAPRRPVTQAPRGCTSLEGCYGFADMQSFYNEIILWIDEFSRATYANMSRPNYVFVAHNTSTVTGCGVQMDDTA